MVYPMCPMVRTRVLDLINFDRLPGGQNAIIAVMSYSGCVPAALSSAVSSAVCSHIAPSSVHSYDIEDAIVLNKASLDRGFGRCIVMRKYSTQVRQYSNQTHDRITAPPENLPDSSSMKAR